MEEKEKTIRMKIMSELTERFPDLDPKIAEVTEKQFTYELEKHGSYSYYSVSYRLTSKEELDADWDNAEMRMM